MARQAYRLVNAEEHAATFMLPPERVRRNLRTPECVKLIFESLDGGLVERLWVRVAGPSLVKGEFVGTVISEPLNSSLPRFGAVVEFGPEHVIDWGFVSSVEDPFSPAN